MKRFFLCFFALLLLAGCVKKEKTPDFYGIGLEVTSLMGEMVENEDYGEILGVSYIDSLDLSGNYTKPHRVYGITLPDNKELLKQYDRSMYKQVKALPEELAEQLYLRYGAGTMISQINVQMGSDYIAAASLYTATLEREGTLQEKVCYLYTFKDGWPIVVSFTPSNKGFSAYGQFLFVEDVDVVLEALEDMEISYQKVNGK